jgi:small subunit ribosomal protein S4e
MARLKRIAAPKIWKFPRKTKLRYTFSPSPGPHAAGRCMTLGYLLRDVLGAAATAREVRELLGRKLVKVDGIVRKDPGYPAGLMDVLSIDHHSWRLLPSKRGFYLQPVKGAEASTKLLKVRDKTFVKGKLQLNFHDGRNMLVDKDVYKTGDVVVFDLGGKKAGEVLQFKRGALGIVTDGKLRGMLGKIEEIILVRGITPNKVVLKAGGRKIETLKDYIFVVGHEKPVVTLHEEKIAEA